MDSWQRLLFSIRLWIIITILLIVMTILFQAATHSQPDQYNEFIQPTPARYGDGAFYRMDALDNRE